MSGNGSIPFRSVLRMYSVIIPAAGSGTRLGSDTPKAFVPITIQGVTKAVVEWGIAPFLSDANCRHVVIAAPKELIQDCARLFDSCTKVTVVAGGATRQQSVKQALDFLTHCLGEREDSTVLVHDAARCNLSDDVISRVVAGVAEFGAVTAAVPVVDAMVRVSKEGTVESEVDRSGVWAVQTPQGFLLKDLHRAHEEFSPEHGPALDDASLVGKFRAVSVVQGDPKNCKVTYSTDVELITLYRSVRARHD
jgi:2-C-methyl-D-erythritol 4-phosphate cytidylyltransferase